MKSFIKLVLFASLMFAVGIEDSSAQFLAFGKKKKVTLNSEPQGATVSMNGQVIGITPCTVKVSTQSRPINVHSGITMDEMMKEIIEARTVYLTFSLDGYEPCDVAFSPDASMRYPSSLFHNFEEASTKAVNRSAPGATDLEQTIVRWYFESEPQGARLFWRVISNCPEQVKNTNELWLGNTPFEETRSFNIQGLTYENANDVQIEIKVRRQGYLDQTKRFNVRQAIDQQEISSFFDMIKAEE